MIVFLDTTALAAVYLDTPEGLEIRKRIKAEGDAVAIAEDAKVEFAVFLRDLRDSGVSAKTIEALVRNFIATMSNDLVVVQDTVGAVQFAVSLPISAPQAAALSAAVKIRAQVLMNTRLVPKPVLFVTLDAVLREAAAGEGFPTLP